MYAHDTEQPRSRGGESSGAEEKCRGANCGCSGCGGCGLCCGKKEIEFVVLDSFVWPPWPEKPQG
ncbi:MAG: hypothetical protein IJU70_05990 [Lentisphaeria bacterium]|nr:hypothetical protein [Lentisphaeria bacterium]